MKIVFRLMFLVAVPLGAQSSVVFSWSHNPLNNGIWPVCSISVQKMCQIGYTLTDITAVSAPVVISSIAPTVLTYRLTPLPSAGSHIYHLVINARGGNGKPVHSAPASVTVKIPVPRSPILDRSAPSGHKDPLSAGRPAARFSSQAHSFVATLQTSLAASSGQGPDHKIQGAHGRVLKERSEKEETCCGRL
jgi:hypothetical protein